MVTSNQVFRSQILYREIFIQPIYYPAKFEFSCLSSLANATWGGGWGGSLKALGTTRDKNPGWNRVKNISINMKINMSR